MKIERQGYLPPGGVTGPTAVRLPAGRADVGRGPGFEEVLRGELERAGGLKISAHAAKRLKERNILLSSEDLARIDLAVKEAAAKGARDSLIIYGDLALIASVKNRTVVTAMERRAAEGHVFTNIDSAVIVNRRGAAE